MKFIYPLVIVFVYACTDEIHQLFIPGREGRFRDVLIDTIGGTIAMFIQYIRITVIKKYNTKSQ